MNLKVKIFMLILTFLILLGFSDSFFLTYEHYTLISVGCPVNPWINCLAVTTSKYSELFGIPLAIFGLIYYTFLLFFLFRKETMAKHFFLLTSSFGVIFSIYLILIQAFVIKLFCLYCLLSALISFSIFGLSFIFYKYEWRTLLVDTVGYLYKFILKPILFLIDAEVVHEKMVQFGSNLPKPILNLFKSIFVKKYPNLKQNILGINFTTPIGLAAGFDYEAKLTETLPFIGFGFETIGTITNSAYEGNSKPMLGRLPKSKSLLVNKGFKNLGIDETLKKLKGKKFLTPVGISIGRTNSSLLDTIDKSVEDIKFAFLKAEKSNIGNAYYELNISCPNIIHNQGINFYDTKNLERLLTTIDSLKIKKPILVKMPIDQGDKKTLSILRTISKHKIKGVVIGNLQTNKNNKVIDQGEVLKFEHGKYSGKPTFDDSNHLIKLTYKNFKNRFVIIGCGGVFNAEDAWIKFTSGATLVQLITGMIYEGPQLISQINRDLSEKLIKNGYKSIREIVGLAV